MIRKKVKWTLPNHTFSKLIIVYCVLYMSRIIERVLNIAEHSGTSHTDIITAAVVFFGGELLILALKFTFDTKSTTEIEKTKLTLDKKSE